MTGPTWTACWRSLLNEEAPELGEAPVETERKLVEVRLEVVPRHSSLVSTQQPSLHEVCNTVYSGQDHVGLDAGAGDGEGCLVGFEPVSLFERLKPGDSAAGDWPSHLIYDAYPCNPKSRRTHRMTVKDNQSAVALDLTRDQLHDVFRVMVLARAAEERLEVLFKQGHITGGIYRSLGQEAGAVGAAYALRRRADRTGDIIAPTVRATGAVFLLGGTPLQFFRQYLARGTGPTGGRESKVYWTDYDTGLVAPVSPLGTMVEVMSGVSLAFRMQGEDRVALVFYGDGASSTGAWHEGLCFAAAQACPLVLMVEANQWAISSPTSTNTRVQSFVKKAAGYGLHAESVDGTDVLAVYACVKRAVARARTGEGAGMVELQYYRVAEHAQHDAQEYVDPDKLEKWKAKDPIARFRDRLLAEGFTTEEELEALADDAHEEVRTAADQALSEPSPDGPSVLEEVYTDLEVRPPWTRMVAPDPRKV